MRSASVRYRIKGTRIYVKPPAATARAGYDAASVAPRLSKWRPSYGGPNSLLTGSLSTLRARSRDAVRQDGTADAGLDALVTNIVGAGIVPQFNTPDAEFNQALADAWLEWTDESDADGRLDFYGQQALIVRSAAEGGDAFARFRVRRLSDGLSVPLQIQVLEGEFCPETMNQPAANGNQIRCGIEFNGFGQRAAYWLYRQHPLDLLVSGGGDLMPVAVPASEVLQLSGVRRPGLIRGEPWLTRALIALHETDEFSDAQLVRQKIAALFAGFVGSEAPELGDEEAVFAGQAEPDSDGIALAPLEPGTMQVLKAGQKIDFNEPPDPGNNYEAFMRGEYRAAAAAIGILYEQLTGDYSQGNDRTWRAAVNEFRRRCAMWQHHLVVYQYCRPVLRRWAELAVLAGRVTLPAGITPAAIARAKWAPQAWEYINPVQDVGARQAEVRNGFRSRRDVVSERGYSVHEVDAEIAADNATADENGFVFDSDPRRSSQKGVAQSPAEPGVDQGGAGGG